MEKITCSLIILCLFSVLFGSFIAKSHKSKSHKHKQTPKAIDLHDHFGASYFGSPY